MLLILVLGSCSTNDSPKIPEDYIARYALNGNALDSGVDEFHGEIFRDVIPSADRDGNLDAAMHFGPNNSFITVDDDETFDLMGEISISVWIKADSVKFSWGSIANKWDGRSFGLGYYLGINEEGYKLRWRIRSAILETDFNIPLHRWVHIVALYDKTYLRLYVDGAEVGELAFPDHIINTSVPFAIGNQSRFSTRSNFHGLIDDVIVYDRALDYLEIRNILRASSHID